MSKKLEYSFDDEPVKRFCYDLHNKKIEIYFEGYYDLTTNEYIEGSCIFVLESWEYGKCKIGDETKLYNIDEVLGIFSLILYMKYNENQELEMLVHTIDNRYLTLFLKDSNLSVILT